MGPDMSGGGGWSWNLTDPGACVVVCWVSKTWEDGRVEDSEMLECSSPGCGMWVHAQCDRISIEDYRLIASDAHPLAK